MRAWPWMIYVALVVFIFGAIFAHPEKASAWFISSFIALTVGTFIVARVRGNTVGGLLMLFGALVSVSGLANLFFLEADHTVLAWVDAVGNAVNTPALLLLALLLMRFPNGEPLSSRWKQAEWFIYLVMVIGAASALLNSGWGGDIDQAAAISPLRELTQPISTILPNVFFPMLVVAFGMAGVSMFQRFGRSTGVERQQMKWLVYATAILMVGMGTIGLRAATETWEIIVLSLSISLLPVAIGIAVMRFGLFEIDLVISRTIVFGAVAAFITGIYAVLVVGLGSWIGLGASNLFLSVVSTAIVALAFEPFRVRAQRVANRLVYGIRATPYEVLSDLTGRLAEAESFDGLLDRMATRLAEGTGAQSAVVWTRGDDGFSPAAGSPTLPENSAHDIDSIPGDVVAVFHEEEVVGALSVVKPRGEQLTKTEKALLDDLAGSAGLVMGKLRLDAALEQKARDLADSRRRLVTAQEVERRRLERDLHDGAQQLVVSLKVKLGIAAQVARGEDAEELATMLDSLAGDTQLAIEEIRLLARGIVPPLLESEGLGVAVKSLAASSAIQVDLDVNLHGDLPRDVESAIYFCISEALTNAGKHAPGSPVQIRLHLTGDRLEFSVSDSGPGLPVSSDTTGGAGIRNMVDRVEAVGGTVSIGDRDEGGVVVRGEVPVTIEAVAV